jgi:death-on-curing protein
VAEVAFLSPGTVLALHQRSLREHGGSDGIRDQAGLESAVAQPQNDYWYGGADIYGVAAAYAFHIAESQAFIDGNKRTGIGSALLCLELAGIDTTTATSDTLYDAMIAIARHEMDKAGLAAVLMRLFAKGNAQC